MVAKKPPKMSFDELLTKKGLEFRNKILVKKETGEKFTGELKRSTDQYKIDSNYKNIETRIFKNGIITEITNKDLFGKELDGKFYKDGKIFSSIDIYHGKNGICYGVSLYGKDGNVNMSYHGFCENKKECFFENCRFSALKNNWPD